MVRPVHLDNNATTPCDPAVIAAMLPFFGERFGNPSSKHGFGTAVGPALREARRSVGRLLGTAFDDEIVFTSGGTESDTTAILSGLATAEGRDGLVVSAVEHPAVLRLAARLAETGGIRVDVIPVDRRGRLDRTAYRRALSTKTAVVSMMWANNETGTIFPVAELAAEAAEVGARFHTDAVQAVGRVPIDLRGTAIDMLSISAHKINGPKGIGALFVRRGTPFRQLFEGGGQERGRRAGTENTPGIVGLGRAAELAALRLDDRRSRTARLRDRLEAGLLASVPDCVVLGDGAARLPNTSAIAFAGAEGRGILRLLDREGIAVSAGSACASGSLEPSHVLRAMRVAADAIDGVVRFSFGVDNGEADVDRVLAVMPEIVARLRAPSPPPMRSAERATAVHPV